MLASRTLLLIGILATQGCATLINGRHQKVLVSSSPSGATVTVDGQTQGTTPTTVSLARKTAHTLYLRSDSARTDSVVLRPSETSGAFWSNLFLFHPALVVAGLGVDYGLGAHRRFPDARVHVTLSNAAVVGGATAGPPSTTDAATVGTASAASANTPAGWPFVSLGSRIRVLPGDRALGPVIGTLTAATADTLIVAQASGGVAQRIPASALRAVDLSLGVRRTGSVIRGAGLGALVGLAIGAVSGAMIGEEMGAFYFGAVGTMAGATLGGVWSVLDPDVDQWLRVYERGVPTTR